MSDHYRARKVRVAILVTIAYLAAGLFSLASGISFLSGSDPHNNRQIGFWVVAFLFVAGAWLWVFSE